MHQFHGSTRGHAIVMGGSMVGAVVAALLAGRFERVTIIERDSLPESPGARPGVPQSRHVHALLARGSGELERLFPGFLGDMSAAGAVMVDIGREAAWLTPAGWGVPFDSGIILCCATRDLIEWQTRRHALRRRNITLIDATAVTGLVEDEARSRVLGIRVRDRRLQAGMHDRELYADLIVDATGRGSHLPEWLEAMGRPAVVEDVVDARMTYASRVLSLAPGALRGWKAAYVQAALPHDPRGGIIFPVEGNRWHLTLFGYGDAAPPDDEAGFLTFARQLRSRIISEILQHATPLTPIVGHRRTENRLRRFERVPRWPDALVAVGDSMCCFDPVYGQGMTTGILGALALAESIDAEWPGGGIPAGFAGRVQRRLSRVVRPAWNLATGEDLRLPSTSGGQLGWTDRVMQAYFDRVVATATVNPRIRKRLLAVMSMLNEPQVLLRPAVMTAVARHAVAPGRPQELWTDYDESAAAFEAGVPLPRAPLQI